MLSHSTAEMVEVLVSVANIAIAAIAAIAEIAVPLPQQLCLFLLVTFLDKRIFVPLTISIISA